MKWTNINNGIWTNWEIDLGIVKALVEGSDEGKYVGYIKVNDKNYKKSKPFYSKEDVMNWTEGELTNLGHALAKVVGGIHKSIGE